MQLNELSLALRQGSQAKQQLAGLDEEYKRAQALRDNPMFNKPNEHGYISPLGVLGDMIANSRGRALTRDLKPQRAAARQTIADTENAPALYQAKTAADAAKQQQNNWEEEQFQNLAVNQENQAHQARLQQAKLKAEQDAAAKLADAERTAVRGLRTYIDADGDESTVQTGYLTNEGLFNVETGEKVPNYRQVPYNEKTQQIKATKSGSGKDDVDPMATVGEPDLVAGLITNELFDRALGALNPERYAGGFGYGYDSDDPDIGPKLQSIHKNIDSVRIDTVKANLEGLGINPTDKDLAVAFESIPDKNTQPLAWVMWVEDQYIPMLVKAGTRAVQDGTISRDNLQAYVSQVSQAAAKGRTMWSKAEQAKTPQTTQPTKSFIRDDEREEYEAWKRKQGI